ncbi:unnamed protein product [Protopolystoma xenopodis]|uniref:Uncharacterized protein n=1 Tax=Protopolystoma xenopodis TaxID=117903 RepID=A0A448WY91_9PLAT|nr:unnamed protein product [Protopolystoma xenopodis]
MTGRSTDQRINRNVCSPGNYASDRQPSGQDDSCAASRFLQAIGWTRSCVLSKDERVGAESRQWRETRKILTKRRNFYRVLEAGPLKRAERRKTSQAAYLIQRRLIKLHFTLLFAL